MKNKDILSAIVFGIPTLFFLCVGLIGCNHHHRKYKVLPKKEVVTIYRVHSKTNMLAEANAVNDAYWYVMTDNSGHYYSATSSTRTTAYSSLNWSRAVATSIKELAEALSEEVIERVAEDTVETADLGMAVEQEIAIDIPEVNSLDSMEGVPDGAVEVDSGGMDGDGDSGSGGDGGGDGGDGD